MSDVKFRKNFKEFLRSFMSGRDGSRWKVQKFWECFWAIVWATRINFGSFVFIINTRTCAHSASLLMQTSKQPIIIPATLDAACSEYFSTFTQCAGYNGHTMYSAPNRDTAGKGRAIHAATDREINPANKVSEPTRPIRRTCDTACRRAPPGREAELQCH